MMSSGNGAAAFNMNGLKPNSHRKTHQDNYYYYYKKNNNNISYGFQMPLHYPRYKKADYEKMPEWKIDCLLKEYGLPATGDVDQKRKFAMGAFLWPDQHQYDH